MTQPSQKIDHAIVDVLIVDDDKFLLVEEGAPGRGGLFNTPGGHVDPHETLAVAAVRETKEETGYDVELTGVLGVYQTIYAHINVSSVVFVARVVGGEWLSSAEHPSVNWVTQAELDSMAKDGKLWTKYPPLAIADYLRRGAYPLDMVNSEDYTKEI